MTRQDLDTMLGLCHHIYRETDPGKLALWINELNTVLQRKVADLRRKEKPKQN